MCEKQILPEAQDDELIFSDHASKQMDILKAVAIVGVVFLHARLGEYLTYVPHWRIPVFVFISGYFFKRKYLADTWAYVKRKITHLLLPALKWQLIYGVIITILLYSGKSQYGVPYTFRTLYQSLFLANKGEPSLFGFTHPLWFVPVLFFTQIVYLFIRRFTLNNKRTDAALSLVFVALNFASVAIARKHFHFTAHPENLNELVLPLSVCYMLAYYHLGYMYHKYWHEKDGFSFYKLLIPLVINICLADVCGYSLKLALCRLTFPCENIAIPFIVDCLSMYFWIQVANMLAYALKPNSVIYDLGKKTFGIMVHQCFCFFLLSGFLFYLKSNFNLDWLAFDINKFPTVGIHCRPTEHVVFFKMLYFFAGLFGAVALDKLCEKFGVLWQNIVTRFTNKISIVNFAAFGVLLVAVLVAPHFADYNRTQQLELPSEVAEAQTYNLTNFGFKRLGALDGDSIVSKVMPQETKILWGPYIKPQNGIYDITLEYDVLKGDGDIGVFEVASNMGEEQIQTIPLAKDSHEAKLRGVRFDSKTQSFLEFRVFQKPNVQLKLKSINVVRTN